MRFGLIGTGFWAEIVHAPGIAGHPRAELVGVWGRDQEEGREIGRRVRSKPFSDVDELIASVDAVAFAVPPDLQAELAVRAAEAGRSLLLEKPLALAVDAAERLVQAVRAPTIMYFTRRFDPGTRRWFATAVDGHAWDGASMLYLASIFEPGAARTRTPAWRRERGALWDLGPHALALLIPTLGRVDSVAAVRGRGDEVHLALRHATGAASSVTLSLTSPVELTDLLLWGSEGVARSPEGDDVVAAYAAAIDALITGETTFDVAFACDVVRVLAAAEEQLLR